MAVIRLGTIERFMGTEAERLAMVVTGVKAGSTFFEDTGFLYTLNGAGNWILKKSASQLTGSFAQVGVDLEFVFANSALANNQQVKTIAAPTAQKLEYELIVNNPSTAVDITVKVFNVEADLVGEVDKDAYITSFVVPKSQAITGTTIDTYAVFVQGLFNGGAVKLVASPNTALAVDGGFTATVRLREVR